MKWVNEPPIVTCNIQVFKTKARELMQLIKNWRGDGEHGDDEHLISWPDAKVSADNGEALCEEIRKRSAVLFSGKVLCYYQLLGQAVGIMQFSTKGSLDDMVVHPAVKFGGATMLEYMLKSMRRAGNNNPVIQLQALDEAARKAWAGFGFLPPDKSAMTLNCQTCAKWAFDGTDWRYTPTEGPMGLRYLADT